MEYQQQADRLFLEIEKERKQTEVERDVGAKVQVTGHCFTSTESILNIHKS